MITAFMSLVFYKDLVKATSRKIVFIFSIIMPMTGFVLMFTLVFFGVLTLPLIGMLVAISACGFALSLASTTVMTADCVDYYRSIIFFFRHLCKKCKFDQPDVLNLFMYSDCLYM